MSKGKCPIYIVNGESKLQEMHDMGGGGGEEETALGVIYQEWSGVGDEGYPRSGNLTAQALEFGRNKGQECRST